MITPLDATKSPIGTPTIMFSDLPRDVRLPAGTRMLRVAPTFLHHGGDDAFNGAWIDNVSVTIASKPPPRVVTTEPASDLKTDDTGSGGQSTATLHGSLTPATAPPSYHFEYGTTTAYGSVTPSQSQSAGNTPVEVSATVTLAPATTYHARLVATNAGGTVDGSDITFTTPALTTGAGHAPIVVAQPAIVRPGNLTADTTVTLSGRSARKANRRPTSSSMGRPRRTGRRRRCTRRATSRRRRK